MPEFGLPDRCEVVHCVAPARVGGLERVVALLVRGQRHRGVAAGVAAVVDPGSEEHPFVAGLRSDSVPVEVLRVPHRAYLSEVVRLRRVFAGLEPEAVHTHGYRSDVLAGTTARRMDIPTVSTVHGFTGGGWKNRLFEWLQRRSLARMDAVVAVSRPLERDLHGAGVDAERLHVVPNAWRPSGESLDRARARRVLDLPEEPFVVGWVGRLSREKGPDVLVRSAAEIADAEVRFSLIGSGREREDLEDLVRSLGLSDRVRFHGLVPRAERVYPAFDVFVLSSRTEGTPVSLFEALQAEVPVVATRVGGIPDVVRHEREALLVPPEDPPALAAALREVRRRPEAARERARRARRRLESEYALEPWLDRYQEIYRKVVGNP